MDSELMTIMLSDEMKFQMSFSQRPHINMVNNVVCYIRLYFTIFLLARSNTRYIPFSSILISKKQIMCTKESYCIVQNQ